MAYLSHVFLKRLVLVEPELDFGIRRIMVHGFLKFATLRISKTSVFHIGKTKPKIIVQSVSACSIHHEITASLLDDGDTISGSDGGGFFRISVVSPSVDNRRGILYKTFPAGVVICAIINPFRNALGNCVNQSVYILDFYAVHQVTFDVPDNAIRQPQCHHGTRTLQKMLMCQAADEFDAVDGIILYDIRKTRGINYFMVLSMNVDIAACLNIFIGSEHGSKPHTERHFGFCVHKRRLDLFYIPALIRFECCEQ